MFTANIQIAGKPRHIVWNFADVNKWAPLFGPGAEEQDPYRNQTDIDWSKFAKINYVEINALQTEIETELKSRIREWRKQLSMRTDFANPFARQIMPLLEKMEEFKCGEPWSEVEHMREIEKFSSAYQVSQCLFSAKCAPLARTSIPNRLSVFSPLSGSYTVFQST